MRMCPAIHLWDLRSGREIGQFGDRIHSVPALAFSPDDKTLASGHGDSSILLWDMTPYRGSRSKK